MNLTIDKTVGIVIFLGMLALTIVSYIGLAYLTKFSFKSKSDKDLAGNPIKYVNMSDEERELAKVTCVLGWIQLGIPVLLGLLAIFMVGFKIKNPLKMSW